MLSSNKIIIIRRVIFCVNILLVMALLFLSVLMFYFSSSKSKTIFGHTALIYTTLDDAQNEQHSLYIVKAGDDDLSIYDEIMFYSINDMWESVPVVDTIESITEHIATLEHSGHLFELDSTEYIGKVTSKHHELGEKLFAFTTSSAPITLYVILGGSFIAVSLSMILLLVLNQKKHYIKSKNPIKQLDELDEIVFINEQQPLIFENDDFMDEKEQTIELPNMKVLTLELDLSRAQPPPPQYIDVDIKPSELPRKPPRTPIKETPKTPVKVTVKEPTKESRTEEFDSYLDEIIKNIQNEADSHK